MSKANGSISGISQKMEMASFEAKLESIRVDSATKQQLEKLRSTVVDLKKSFQTDLQLLAEELRQLRLSYAQQTARMDVLVELVMHLMRTGPVSANLDLACLLMSGADPSIKNNAGETALDVCKSDEASVQLAVRHELLSRNKCPELYERVIMSDLSRGRESYKIPVVNGVDTAGPPTNFRYLTQSAFCRGVEVTNDMQDAKFCNCNDNCVTSICTCTELDKLWYDENGLLIPEFNPKSPALLFECNSVCNCSMSCRNRVVQKGCQVRIEVFKTAAKGWGIRTLEALPRGKFVIEYVGEVLSEDMLAVRSDEYLFDLDSSSFCPETVIEYSIDATKFGNVSRFFNHSCEPNMMPVKAFVDHWDLRFPRIAFFTIRPVKKYEELCFDYGPKFWSVKSSEFLCNCQSPGCKYNSREKIDAFIQIEATKLRPQYMH